jgi:Laminin B (Domain IV)
VGLEVDTERAMALRRGKRLARRFAAMLGALSIVALVVQCADAQARAGRTLVSQDFTDSAGGWTINGDTGSSDPMFMPTGGHPGGCITGVDEALGETWYFRAPSTVLQRLPAAVNGTISFSLKQSGAQISLFDDDIVIVGPAGRLSYRFPVAPGTDWTDFSVRLSESEGWVWNWNKRATQGQIESVLAAPTRLDIRGEFVTGPDEGSLDNFALTAAPGWRDD